MKRSSWLIVVIMLVISISVLWFNFQNHDDPNLFSDVANEEVKDSTEYLEYKVIKPSKKKAKAVANEAVYNPYENEELKAQLQQVSDLYEEQSKYPITSQPIYQADDVREFMEFEESEVDLPFPADKQDTDPIRVVAATNAFQYFKGDVIDLKVVIKNGPPDTFTQVQASISGANGVLPNQLDFRPSNESLTEFRASFDTSDAPKNLMSDEMLAIVNVNIGDRSLKTTVLFQYATASAHVNGLGASQVQGPNLAIPVQLNVYQDGYYFMSAILEDLKTQMPLVKLQQEKRLAMGNAIIELNAHIAALKLGKSEGPYVLRSINLYRASKQNEQFNAPGGTTKSHYNVSGFPFSSYADEEYVDELAQERLAFLRSMGSLEENTEQAEEQP